MFSQTIALLLLICSICEACPHNGVYWRDYVDGCIPKDAYIVEKGLYIGQLPINGNIPGTLYANKKVAVGLINVKRGETRLGVKILCTSKEKSIQWEYVNTSNLTVEYAPHLVIGGIENGQTLYIGKLFHDGQWKISKVYPAFHSLRGLRTWTSTGLLQIFHDFQILRYVDIYLP